MLRKIQITLMMSLGLAACNSQGNHDSHEHETTDTTSTQQSLHEDGHETQIAAGQPEYISSYITLKDALVSSDASMAATVAAGMMEQLQSAGLEKLTAHAETIAASEDLEAQRVAFKLITEELITQLKSTENTEYGLYVQYCPMAFDNTGGTWISQSEEIRNPYYGDKMLKCGKVEERL